jgi:hypothetical protein
MWQRAGSVCRANLRRFAGSSSALVGGGLIMRNRSEYSANLALASSVNGWTGGADFAKPGPALARRVRRGFFARLLKGF